MQNLVLFTEKEKQHLLKKRKGESKFGEHIQLIPNLNNIYDEIVKIDVDYIIFGVAEDIGVLANYGNTGTSKAYSSVIKILLNIQNNTFTQGNRVAVLGHLAYEQEQKELLEQTLSKKKTRDKARHMVERVDTDVTYLVSIIVKAGKIPIVIGGGHNNAYGNLKGCALALNKRMNAVNLDAHSDFRPEEGRHSGNGFSYAYAEGFLKAYYMFGLHENYTSDQLFKTITKLRNLKYSTYESMEVRQELDYYAELEKAYAHIADRPFGIEIDCDAIESIPSSAITPSGFSTKQARQFVHCFGKSPNATYLHICEASPTQTSDTQIGKLISYFITDFIRAHGS